MLVTVSGASPAHSPQARSTRCACVQSQASIPAYARGTGSRSNSSAVTTPKPPPPPRAAQSSSLSAVSVARTNVPSARTSSTAVSALHCRPPRRAYQLSPPPREEPTTPTPGLVVCRAARPRATGPVDDVSPPHTGADPGGTSLGVDVQLGHGRGPQQDRVLEPAGQRRRTVAGALRGDLEADRGRRADHVRDLGRERRVGHGRGPDVDLQVPRHPDLVEGGVAGQVHGAAAQPAQHVGSRPPAPAQRPWQSSRSGRPSMTTGT